MKVLVTGGLGFIGSAVVRSLVASGEEVVNIDKVSYASTFESVGSVSEAPNYVFEKVDITDEKQVIELFDEYAPEAVMHLAAESHVDRSIDGPGAFIESNVAGTFNLLEAAKKGSVKRFLHVSTDEVFGSLTLDDEPFNESTPYSPRSPYSASKAASDHLVRAWGETYDLPVVITNCSNNYGPYQFPEKLIPITILRALNRDPIAVYGTGENIRDWLYVEDHARALTTVLSSGELHETYLIGGNNEVTNLDLVKNICRLVDELEPSVSNSQDLIEFVTDRPGHDHRYAIDASKISTELGWSPETDLEDGLKMTVEWYLANRAWWEPLVERGAIDRLGTSL